MSSCQPASDHFVVQNPNATLPALTAGDEKYINTAEVTKFLVQNAKSEVRAGSSLIAKIHEPGLYDPNFLRLLAVSLAVPHCLPPCIYHARFLSAKRR